jgi:uncharacterized membrane protein
MLTRAVAFVAVALALLGVAAAAGRGVFVEDFGQRVEPMRRYTLRALDREDPRLQERPREIARFDGRFAAHPRVTLTHVAAGGVFLFLGPLQFSSSIRRRYPALHRWCGRLLMLLAVLTGVSGLYFGLFVPFSGRAEATVIALVGVLLLGSIARAYVAIRRYEVERHREWMIRAFALGVGISTVRLVAAVLDVALTPYGITPERLFVLSLWIGWLLTVVAAELWIRHTRRSVLPGQVPTRRALSGA